ncbi:hypothetical protein [Corallococcus sp. M7]
MILINNVAHVPSELVEIIKKDNNTPWRASYEYYLMQINASNSTFTDFGGLILKLGGLVMGEPKQASFPKEADYQRALARYRGTPPTPNSAIVMAPLTRLTVNRNDQAAIAYLLDNGYSSSRANEASAHGITNRQPHQSDPETGAPKAPGVDVIELYINGPEGRRVTIRTETFNNKQKVTTYYSSRHVENTYDYQRLS